MTFSAKIKEELAQIKNTKPCCIRAGNCATLMLSGEPLNAEQQALSDCCLSSFLREVFLRCGSVTDPEKAYRLEFSLQNEQSSEVLADLIETSEALEFRPKYILRGEHHILYFKENERISDFLAFIGAAGAMMEFLQAAMLREVRGNINRRVNFETANMSKTAAAAKSQIEAAEKLLAKYGDSYFSEKERQLLRLRLDNPDHTLRELGEAMTPTMSRSGVNRILQKILLLSESNK